MGLFLAMLFSAAISIDQPKIILISGPMGLSNSSSPTFWIITPDSCNTYLLNWGTSDLVKSECHCDSYFKINETISDLFDASRNFTYNTKYTSHSWPITVIKTEKNKLRALEIDNDFTNPYVTIPRNKLGKYYRLIESPNRFTYVEHATQGEVDQLLSILDQVFETYQKEYICKNAFLNIMLYRTWMYQKKNVSLPDLQLNLYMLRSDFFGNEYLFTNNNWSNYSYYSYYFYADKQLWTRCVYETIRSIKLGVRDPYADTALKFMYYYGDNPKRELIIYALLELYAGKPGKLGEVSMKDLSSTNLNDKKYTSLIEFISFVENETKRK